MVKVDGGRDILGQRDVQNLGSEPTVLFFDQPNGVLDVSTPWEGHVGLVDVGWRQIRHGSMVAKNVSWLHLPRFEGRIIQ